jgi:hypothetical protein
MSTRAEHPWPAKLIPAKKIHDVRQIAFCIRDDAAESKDGLLAVYSLNIYERPLRSPKLWRIIPAAYGDYLRRILHRNVHLFLTLDMIKERQIVVSDSDAVVDYISRYIVYNDVVLDNFWERVRVETIHDNLGPDWRSRDMDRWLAIDYHVGKHSAASLEAYIKTHGDASLQDDPIEFGECYFIYSHFTI